MPVPGVGIFVLYSGMGFIRQHGWFLLVFIAGTLLRFSPLFDYQFTFDELSGLDRTQFNSTSEVLEKGVKIDAHPALVQLIIYYITSFFGYETWLVKLPFLLMGQAAVLYAYLFGIRHFSKQAGIIATIYFSFSLIFVFYAPIARMYISGVFFSTALLYYFYNIFFRGKNSFFQFLMLAIFAWLCALNHHMSALFAACVCVSGFYYAAKFNLRPYVITCILTVLAYLPHLPITLYQLSIPGIGADTGGWLTVPGFSKALDFLPVLLGTGYAWMVAAVLLVVCAFYRMGVPLPGGRTLLLILFGVNFMVVFLYSVFRSPVFQNSVMLFSGCAFVLWLSSGLDSKTVVINNLVVVLLIAVLGFQTYVRKDYLRNAVKTVYEYQFERTLHYKKLFGEKEVYPVFFDCDTLMRKIYFSKYNCHFDFKSGSDPEISYGSRVVYGGKSSTRLFCELLQQIPSNYLAVSSASPLYQALITEYFPYLVENTQTQGIDFKLYSKTASTTVAPDQLVFDCSIPSNCGFEYIGKLPFHADSTNEFPFTVRFRYDLALKAEGQTVLVRTKLRMTQKEAVGLESIISANIKGQKDAAVYSGTSCEDFLQRDSVLTMYSCQFAGTQFSGIHKHAQLSTYLWNKSHLNFTIDSIRVRSVNYWPLKWSWWN